MKRFFIAAFSLLTACAGAWQIDLSYQIVIPEKYPSPWLKAATQQGAEALQDTLSSHGIKIPVVTENKKAPGKKSIFLGGNDGRKYEYYNGSIRIDNRNIYIRGNDVPGKLKRSGYYHDYAGSLKALTVFMERFLNARFVFPAKEGIVSGKLPQLPEKLSLDVKPRLYMGGGRYCGFFLYDLANNNFGSGSFYLHGGHSHDKAVTPQRYGKSHPEYFSLFKGKRTHTLHYHGHCLSNPAVAELIYKDMVRNLLATGADVIEVGPTDGNVPCQCSNCLAMPGGKDPGERLWLFHFEQARRLAKDHPGKKMLIICYWPNFQPPKSVKKLPDNVMVELSSYTPASLKAWQDHTVPGGFSVYIYNWGWYDREGFAPKRCRPAELAEQVRNFVKYGIKGVYRCGFGEQFGLEGPAYYVFGKLIDAPEADPDGLLKEYCQRVFGNAAPEMEKFYQTLYDRQKITLLPLGVNRWSRMVGTKRRPGELEPPVKLNAARYPDSVMKELRSLLEAGYKKFHTPLSLKIKQRIETEFKYLELTAGIACCMETLQKKSDPAVAAKMMAQVRERNALISSLPKDKPSYFGGAAKDVIRVGGRMYGLTGFPYNIKGDIPACGRTIKVNGPAQNLVDFPHKVQLKCDDKNLYVSFLVYREKTGEDKLSFYFGGAEGKVYRFTGWLDKNKRVFPAIRLKTSVENGGKDEVSKAVNNKGMTLTLTGKPGEWIPCFTIPWSAVGGKPAAGEKRYFNASYLEYAPDNNRKQLRSSVWEFNPARLNWRQSLDRGGIAEF